MNAEKMIKVGIIGTGSSAVSHIKALKSSKHFAVIGFLTSTDERKKTFESQTQIEGFTDAKLFLEKLELDFVVISNVSDSHAAFAEMLLPYQIPVLVDKPIDASFQKSKLVVEKFQSQNVPLFVGLQKRFDQATNFLKENLDKEIGELLFVNLNICMPRNAEYFKNKNWLLKKDNFHSGALLHLGIHAFDQIDWIIDKKIKRVYASSSKKNNGLGIDDTILGNISYQDGTFLNFNFTISTQKNFKNKFEFVGKKDTIVLVNDRIFGVDDHNLLEEKRRFLPNQLGNYANFYDDIFSRITFQKASKICASSVLRTEKLISDINQSCRSNIIVNSDK